IEALDFTPEQKERLREVSERERDDLFANFDVANRLAKSFHEWAEFKNWLSIRQIFLTIRIFEGFADIRDTVQKILVHVQMYVGRERMSVEDWASIGRTLIVDVNDKIEKLGT